MLRMGNSRPFLFAFTGSDLDTAALAQVDFFLGRALLLILADFENWGSHFCLKPENHLSALEFYCWGGLLREQREDGR